MSAVPTTAPRPTRRAGAAPAGRPRQRPALRVVAPVRHARRYVAASILVGAIGVFGVVSLAALAAEQAFAARAHEVEIAELTARYEELTAEVAALEAPGRVRDVAVSQLGMVPAEAAGFLVVERPGTDLGVSVAGATDPPAGSVADPVKQALLAQP